MDHLLPDSRTVKRNLILVADGALTRAEKLWVEIAGGRARRNERTRLDPTTGRTSVDHLQQSGIADRVWPLLEEALGRGVEPEKLSSGFKTATNEAGNQLATELQRRAPQMLRDHRASARGMHRRMRAAWGPAFDAFYEFYVCVEELGSDLQQLHGCEADPLTTALLALHARACLVLAEVHALMVQGFPLGAWARTRSLHETAVIATLLSNHGREAETDDLGERFLVHAAVDEARDLELAVRNGVHVDEEVLFRIRSKRDDVVGRFGPMFAKDYGWARPLFSSLRGKERVTFERLEELADSGLNRLEYRVGGHHVHSSAWTVVLNQVTRGDTTYRLTGPVNVGFGDPASVALAAALVSMSAIVGGLTDRPEPMNLLGLAALKSMRLRSTELFAEAEAFIGHREARLQAKVARREEAG